jgi:hypothetical protein
MANYGKINEQIEAIKKQAEMLFNSSGTLTYDIYTWIPSVNNNYNKWGSYNSRTSRRDGAQIPKEEAKKEFLNSIDTILKTDGLAKLKVVFGDGKNTTSVAEVEVQEQYASQRVMIQPAVEEPKTEKKVIEMQDTRQFEKENKLSEENLVELMGLAFLGREGLGSTSTQYGIAGVMMAARENSVRREIEETRLREKLEQQTAQIATFEAEKKILQDQNQLLQKKIERLTKKLNDLLPVIEKAEKMENKTAKIAAIGSELLGGIAVNMLSRSKYAGLLGLIQDEEGQEQPATSYTVSDEDEEPVIVEEE